MGNDQSSQGKNRMAISAMSNVLKLTKQQLLELRDTSLVYASTGKGDEPSVPTISRRDFRIAMSEVGVVADTDGEVLDKLFTMSTKAGVERVDIVLFLTGISPLASLMDVTTKLRFAFEVFDYEVSGLVSYSDMVSVLAAMNSTASYFGDAVVTSQQIEIVVEDVFKSATNGDRDENIAYAKYIDEIAAHPIVEQFARGEGSMRYSGINL